MLVYLSTQHAPLSAPFMPDIPFFKNRLIPPLLITVSFPNMTETSIEKDIHLISCFLVLRCCWFFVITKKKAVTCIRS